MPEGRSLLDDTISRTVGAVRPSLKEKT